MAQTSLAKRVAQLEQELADLKRRIDEPKKPASPWWESLFGVYRDDPAFLEAMKYGREYRESLRPKPKKRRGGGRNGHPRH